MSPQPQPRDIHDTVARDLAEDIGSGDVTASLIAATTMTHATVRLRESAVLCGTDWFNEVFHQIDPGVTIDWRFRDGEEIAADSIVCELQGPARAILSGERTALNFLQTLSGTATITRRHVAALAGTHTRLLDTRKTIPGLRTAQKYAVRCGGAFNHRHGLFDAVLIKENHIAAAGSISAAVAGARQSAGPLMIEVEVESLDELSEALATDADRVLLDNFALDDLRRAVTMRDERFTRRTTGETVSHPASFRRPELEASGDMRLETLRPVAQTGVDFISMGALTKHLRAIDYSMRFTMRLDGS